MRDYRLIFDRTSGRCHICGKHLSYSNYGKFGRKGAWEIEHSVAKALGGSDHGNNLFAACISCNRVKGIVSSRTARRQHGRTCAPLSAAARVRRESQAVIKGAGIGAGIGCIAGPGGAVVGVLIGAVAGAVYAKDH